MRLNLEPVWHAQNKSCYWFPSAGTDFVYGIFRFSVAITHMLFERVINDLIHVMTRRVLQRNANASAIHVTPYWWITLRRTILSIVTAILAAAMVSSIVVLVVGNVYAMEMVAIETSIASRDSHTNDRSIIRTWGRYGADNDVATAVERLPLLAVQRFELPNEIATVGDAMTFVLEPSGFCLIESRLAGSAVQMLLASPIAQVQRVMGPLSILEAIRALAGVGVEVTVDPILRRVGFELKSSTQRLTQLTEEVSPIRITTRSKQQRNKRLHQSLDVQCDAESSGQPPSATQDIYGYAIALRDLSAQSGVIDTEPGVSSTSTTKAEKKKALALRNQRKPWSGKWVGVFGNRHNNRFCSARKSLWECDKQQARKRKKAYSQQSRPQSSAVISIRANPARPPHLRDAVPIENYLRPNTLDIPFAVKSSRLNDDGKMALDTLLQHRTKISTVSLRGTAGGMAASRQRQAQQRAQNVKRYLLQNGVAASVIHIVDYDPDAPGLRVVAQYQ